VVQGGRVAVREFHALREVIAAENIHMKTYDIFTDRSGSSVLVKRGFSWPAFLFGPIWAAIKRAWLLFFILSVVYLLVLAFDLLYVGESNNLLLLLLLLALYLSYMTVCGLYGNRWLARALLRKGYVRTGDVND
jgi:hypothetical protein